MSWLFTSKNDHVLAFQIINYQLWQLPILSTPPLFCLKKPTNNLQIAASKNASRNAPENYFFNDVDFPNQFERIRLSFVLIRSLLFSVPPCLCASVVRFCCGSAALCNSVFISVISGKVFGCGSARPCTARFGLGFDLQLPRQSNASAVQTSLPLSIYAWTNEFLHRVAAPFSHAQFGYGGRVGRVTGQVIAADALDREDPTVAQQAAGTP